ncbi:hypothetical protein ACFRQM_52385 [Streptomyces sp. NPDC056831]|uniref:hypothetical protein n=1 Tax=Streptomyces sp. NPDC056831 TaxID=3345954 RepID=UPI003681A444
MIEEEQPDELEEHSEQAEPVDLSRFYASALSPLQDYFKDWNAQLNRQLSDIVAAAQVRPVIPRITFDPAVFPMGRIAETLKNQLADMTGFNDAIRAALQPLTVVYQEQWRDIFASFGDLIRQIYPENLREAAPGPDELETLLVDEGIPLMWVPGPQAIVALLDASDAAARRRIIGQRWKGIVNDCEAVLEGVEHPSVQDARGFALDVAGALRAGHTNAAQALAANLLDSVLQRHFDQALRVQLTKNDFRAKGIKFKLDDYKFKVACTFAPVWYAHAKYYPKNGDPIPRVFGRHPSAHGVSRAQYSRINAMYALMLVTSVIKFFDTELPRSP